MRLNRMDLNQLVSLDALIAERNVSRAAERLFVSQSAMSWTLARLREHFSDPLLVRGKRGMMLTPFAETLRVSVRELLFQAQALTSRRPDTPMSEVERTVRVTASDYTALTILASAMQRAERDAPGLRIELRSLVDFTPERLDAGDIDLLIVATAAMDDRHPHEALVRDEYVVIVSADNAAVDGALTMEQYRSLGHVATRWGSARMMTIDDIAMRDLRIERRDEIVVPEFTFAPAFIVGTARIATIQRRLAEMFACQWPVRIVELPLELPPITLSMQWPRHQRDDPVLAWMRGLLHHAADRGAKAVVET